MIQLSDVIQIFTDRNIGEFSCVFHGEKNSRVTGKEKCAIRFVPYSDHTINEGIILNKLKPHKHIIHLLGCDTFDLGTLRYCYTAVKLYHDQNLHDHIIANKNNNVPFDPRTSISQAKQLLTALEHIHCNEIIHGDIKPHNVYFSLDKKTLVIANFKKSKQVQMCHSVSKNSSPRVGVNGYGAPETYNSNEISQRADIYSLGLVLCFLWSNGLHAFGDDLDLWNYNIKKDQNRDLSHLLLPNKLEAEKLLNSMLQFSPQNRPTAAAINEDFCIHAARLMKQGNQQQCEDNVNQPCEQHDVVENEQKMSERRRYEENGEQSIYDQPNMNPMNRSILSQEAIKSPLDQMKSNANASRISPTASTVPSSPNSLSPEGVQCNTNNNNSFISACESSRIQSDIKGPVTIGPQANTTINHIGTQYTYNNFSKSQDSSHRKMTTE